MNGIVSKSTESVKGSVNFHPVSSPNDYYCVQFTYYLR